MTVSELILYYRLEDEIDERAEEICEVLDLLYRCYVKPVVNKDNIRMEILDYENNEVDSLTMTFEQFVSDNYLNCARGIRKKDKEQKIKAEIEAKRLAEVKAKENRRKQYELLKKEFEGETDNEI